MKTKIYLLITFIFLSQLTFAENEWNGRHTKEKTIKKNYAVNHDAVLKVTNSYGNINIITYSGTTVSIEVKIKTNGDNLDKVQEKLKNITVDFQASPSLVVARTIFDKNKSNSWWNWGSSNNVNMEVSYLIKLPVTNSVDLSNNYGSINLDRLDGHAKISCDYGKITTKELMADNNLISFDYTNNSYFEYIKSGKINADYSGFTVSKTKNLNITADYTTSLVEIAEDVTYKCDYGSITIEKSNNIIGHGDYLTARFGEVYKNVNIVADYGSIKIDRMNVNAGNIDITSDYTGITIGYDPDYQFRYHIKLEYASLRGAEDFNSTHKTTESSNKFYQGYTGDGNTGNLINIISEYGSVTFKRN